MTENDVVEFIKEWQAGFFFVVGCVLAGATVGLLLSRLHPPYGGLIGAVVGVVAAFIVFSYLLYGRKPGS